MPVNGPNWLFHHKMSLNRTRTDVAFFLATSGHSGVDRVMANLIGEFSRRGVRMDLLHVKDHGPYLDPIPEHVRIVELGTQHVSTSLFPLIRYLRRERPAALLSDKDKVNRTALWARAIARARTRVVVRMGTTVSKNLERRGALHRRLQLWSIRLFYRWAHGIIVPSAGAADDLAAVSGLPRERISAVPSPVITQRVQTLAREEPDHPWLREQDSPVILGVGELCARKDFDTLIRAFAMVRRSRPAKLIILGEGRRREKLMGLIRELGLEGDVDLPGFKTNPYAYMARASAFALSSTCEGAPVVLMEALALGTPCASTDCPSGPREILAAGHYGPLVPVGDAEALGEALLSLLESPPPANNLRQGAQRYSAEASATEYLKVLGLAKAEGAVASINRE
jgi:glycosyltransferase involved in cell wall biosynthesis